MRTLGNPVLIFDKSMSDYLQEHLSSIKNDKCEERQNWSTEYILFQKPTIMKVLVKIMN